MKESIKKILPFATLVLVALPYLATLPLDVIDIDSAQYAEISREMVESGNYLNIRDNGKTYLDKPIFSFWMISLSFKLFGVSNLFYRIPALLFLFVSAFTIYKIMLVLGKSKQTGFAATIIYLSFPGVYSMAVDPKIDIYLTSILVFIFHAYFYAIAKSRNWYYLMYFWIGVGAITKGPISLVIPVIAIGGDILIRRDWNRLLQMHLIPGLLIACSLPVFWSYILYQEYSWYGPHFFLWIQSFGRFYRDMYNQSLNPAYFYQTFSYSITFFIIPLLFFFYTDIRSLFKEGFSLRNIFSRAKEDKSVEGYIIHFWCFLILFFISFSRYQLPQYVYWILPATAIYLADRLFSKPDHNRLIQINLIFSGIILFVSFFLPVLQIQVGWFLFSVLIFVYLAIFISSYFFNFRHPVFIPGITAGFIFCLITFFGYPELLKYQPSKEVANYIKEQEPSNQELLTFRFPSSKRSYSFYSGRILKPIYDKNKLTKYLSKSSRLVLVPSQYINHFRKFLGKKYRIEIVKTYASYKVATPTASFFTEKNRDALLKKVSIARIKSTAVKRKPTEE